MDSLILNRRAVKKDVNNDMGRWREIDKKTLSSDGELLFIQGFNAQSVKITGVISAAESKNSSVGYAIGFNPNDCLSNKIVRGQCLDQNERPFKVIAESVGNYIVADMPSPKDTGYQSQTSRSACSCQAYEIDGSISSVTIYSTNGKLAKGSWFKVEIWEN